MTKDRRLLALLGIGYFPDELPPPFTTSSFAKYRKAIGKAWASIPNEYPKTIPEIYSVPRAKQVRRDLSIVNPIAEFHVSKLISENWIEIRKHLNSCNFGPAPLDIADEGSRAIDAPDFRLIALKNAEITASYDHLLTADISRFYGTLYTHAIPWALHGKAWSKQFLNTATYNSSLGARLDKAVRKGNDNQTIGIPVGPDSSRIISEIVAVSIDTELRSKIGISSSCALRNVDDWCIGFDTIGQSEDAIAAIASACKKYQLEIHPDKTVSLLTGNMIDAVWPTTLREAQFGISSNQQSRAIEHFFALAYDFARLHPFQNVLDFAVKRTMAVKIFPDNWHRYETYLLKAVRTNVTTLPGVVRILASYNAMGYSLGRDRIKKLITDLIRRGAPVGYHSEISWALFLAKALSIQLNSKEIEPVTDLESSVCALITLDFRSRSLISGSIDTSLWQQSMTTNGLTSNNWLLAYEAEIKGWLPITYPSYVDGHKWFRPLKKYGVSFYDPARNVKHIRSRKPKTMSPALSELLSSWRANPIPIPVQTLGMSLLTP